MVGNYEEVTHIRKDMIGFLGHLCFLECAYGLEVPSGTKRVASPEPPLIRVKCSVLRSD